MSCFFMYLIKFWQDAIHCELYIHGCWILCAFKGCWTFFNGRQLSYVQISLILLRFVFKVLSFLRVVLSRFDSKSRLSSTAKTWLIWVSSEGLRVWEVSIAFGEIWFPLSLMWYLRIVLLTASQFFLASWIFIHSMAPWFTNQQQTQGIPVHSLELFT